MEEAKKERTRVKVTTDGAVVKEIVTPGRGNPPPEGSRVSIWYEGKVGSGERKRVFDTNRGKKPYTFKLGVGQVIQVLDLTVASMSVGEVCSVWCAPAYGFANLGCPPRVPPNATLEFSLELVSVEEIDRATPGTVQETIAAAAASREEGTALFKKEQVKAAEERSPTPDEKKLCRTQLVNIYGNLVLCKIKSEERQKALEFANLALEIDPQSTKALFRKGQAHMFRKEYTEAYEILKQAAEKEPNDKSIKEYLEKAAKFVAQEEQRTLWKGILNTGNGKSGL